MGSVRVQESVGRRDFVLVVLRAGVASKTVARRQPEHQNTQALPSPSLLPLGHVGGKRRRNAAGRKSLQ